MRSRRTPEALRSKVWEQLRTMLAKEVMRISSSPYAAGIRSSYGGKERRNTETMHRL
jgi:hypothetical protein